MKIILLLALLGVTASASAEDKPSRFSSYALYTTLHGADLASTEIALARGVGREGNPLPGMQSAGGRLAIKTLAMVGMAELDYKLAKRKSKKAMWGVRLGTFALTAFVVHHNLNVK